MSRMIKKLTAWGLSLSMLVSCLPAGLAEEEITVPETPEQVIATPTDLEQEEEPALFAEGYARLSAGTVLYADKDAETELGTLAAAGVVYVQSRTTVDGADRDLLAVLLALEGEARTAWVRAGRAEALTAEEAAQATEDASVRADGHLLP